MTFVIGASLAARAADSAASVAQDPSRVIAIDVSLEPSADMARFAESANKGVRRAYPEGFTLGADHPPHISLVRCYVRVGDLPELETRVAAVLAANNPLLMQLAAVGYTHSRSDDLPLMKIAIERSYQLSLVQAKIAEAVEPFSIPDAAADAFATSRELPKVDQSTIDDVKNYASQASGKNYKPHITIGPAPDFVVKDIEAIRFPRRTFRPAAVAIYQLGNYGTAQTKLWTWKR
jgi:hypothetical protein